MRILILTQFFPPEIGATQIRLHTFAEELAKLGHAVEVICGVPNHPQGVIRPEYRGSLIKRGKMQGFGVTYVWVYTKQQKTTRSRLAYYASYAGLSSLAGAMRARPDVVLASSPPLPVAAAGVAIAARHRVPWVMDVRDLWPAAAVAMGELRGGRALRWAEQLERWLYGNAAAITVVTEPFRAEITKAVDSGKISLIPNGTTEFWLEADEAESDRSLLGLPEDKFIWTFAGNVGSAQGLATAVEAAEILGDEYLLLILGDGPDRASLEGLARRLGTASVEFRSQVPPQEARRYLSSSDALLVPLAPDPIFEDFVPSKLFDCCATGKPVICAAAGEASRLVAAADAAFVVENPGDPRELSQAVMSLARDPACAAELGGRGKAFASRNLRRAHVAELERVLEGVVGESR